MKSKAMSAKQLLVVLSAVLVGGIFAACGTPAAAPQVVRETVVVQATQVVRETVVVEGTPQVVERVVTATPEPTSAPPSAGEPIENVRISINSKLTAPDAHKQMGLGAFMLQYLVGGQLFRLNPDFSVTPYLAEGYEVSDDGLTYTVKLKPDLKFSDGSPITAEDVVYTFTRSTELKNPRNLQLGPLESVTAVDPQTVEFKLTQPFPNLLIGLADAGFSIYPKAALEADPDYFAKGPFVSAGQYVLSDWTPGASEWTVSENPEFFGGPSMVKNVTFVAVPDQTSRVLQVTTGAIDYAYDLPASARQDFPEEVKTFAVPILGMYNVNFNLERAKGQPWGDPKVRQAISLAIDRQAIQDRAFFGISPAAEGFLYKGPPEWIGVLPNGGKQDLEAAKALLAETDWPNGGFGFSIQPWGQRPGWTDAATIIKENLAGLGIEVTVEPKTDADAIANLNAGNYDAQFSGNTQDPLSMLKNQFAEGGTWTKWSRYNNPEVTKALVDAGFAADQKTRIELFHKAQELAYGDMVFIPISERVVLVASRIPRNILCEANLLPGYNPRIATVQEFTDGSGPCK
ncbi:MAG: ABC transporter substrate-binding protein [Anaerolineae bacterium]|nr:ABC transporter substrate-binding protein [Anaerolineae bacterium]